VRRITDECYAHALEILRDHREQLDGLAAALLEHETLDEADAYRAAGLLARERGDRERHRAVATTPGTLRA
jgi:cell division protease FtsH